MPYFGCYNQHWLLEKNGYRSPAETRRTWMAAFTGGQLDAERAASRVVPRPPECLGYLLEFDLVRETDSATAEFRSGSVPPLAT